MTDRGRRTAAAAAATLAALWVRPRGPPRHQLGSGGASWSAPLLTVFRHGIVDSRRICPRWIGAVGEPAASATMAVAIAVVAAMTVAVMRAMVASAVATGDGDGGDAMAMARGAPLTRRLAHRVSCAPTPCHFVPFTGAPVMNCTSSARELFRLKS